MKASHKLADAPVVLAIALAVFLSGEIVGLQDRASESRTLVLSGAKIYPAPDVAPIANGVEGRHVPKRPPGPPGERS